MKKSTPIQTGYAPVNGLEMYYEIHGPMSRGCPPLLLLHGALSTIDTSFGKLLPALAQSRQVLAVEWQGHGRTADIARPLCYAQMAEDTAALLKHIGIEQADLFGYSIGGGIALQVAIRHPQLVRKLIVASVTYNSNGIYPEILAGIEMMTPDALNGTPFQADYIRVAPNPEAWPALMAKVQQMDRQPQNWPPAMIQAIQSPSLVVIGDSDLVRPEHAVEMFRLLGGGVVGDIAGLPRSQLAVLPGTIHVGLMERAAWLLPMIVEFFDAPMPMGSNTIANVPTPL